MSPKSLPPSLAHMRRVGANLAALEREDRAREALRDGGDKILEGLRHSEAVLRHVGLPAADEPPEGVQLMARWRALHG